MRINQNIMANNAYRNLSTTNMSLGKSLEKLSSGFRINRAADDAAGLVISQNLRAQTSGLRQATRNAQDGISVVQTAEGALNEVHSLLNRMRDLSVQSANSGANDAPARSAAQAEITAMTSEINRIADSTAFGGTKLLDGNYGLQATATPAAPVTAAATGANADQATVTVTPAGGTAVTVNLGFAAASVNTLSATTTALAAAVNTTTGTTGITATVTDAATGAIRYSNATAASTAISITAGSSGLAGGTATAGVAQGTDKQFQIGANSTDVLKVSIGSMKTVASNATTAGLKIGGLDVTSDTGAAAAIVAFDLAIGAVSTQRGSLGAVQNRFESMINNLQVTTENLVASESRIRDTDMAAEMTNFTKNQILSQAGTAMLAQANQVPQSILSLLR